MGGKVRKGRRSMERICRMRTRARVVCTRKRIGEREGGDKRGKERCREVQREME